MRLIPTLHYDDNDKGGSAPATVPTPAPAKPAQAPAAPANAAPAAAGFTVDDMLKVLDTRTQRAEKNAMASIAQQYGMTENEVTALMEEAKKKRATQLPADAQKQIDEANAKLAKYQLSAEIAKEGAALGLLDADVAMQLLPSDAIKTNNKGELTGVKEALEKLKTDKPYLFGTSKPTAMAQKVTGAPAGNEPSAKDEIRDIMYPKK